MDKISIGLIQLTAEETPAENLRKTLPRIEEAAAKGAKIIGLQEMFTTKYFCIDQNPDRFDLAEPIPAGTTVRELCAAAKRLGVVIVAPMFEARGNEVYHNTAAVIDADGTYLGKYRKMHIPQDPRFSRVGNGVRQNRRLHLLGSVVPGSGALDRARGSADSFLSDGDRLASRGKSGARRGAALRMGNRATRARRGKRLFRCRDESRRHRGTHGILGTKLRRKSLRRNHRARVRRQGRSAHRRMRSRTATGISPHLAVLPRPPHRRLRRNHATFAGLKNAMRDFHFSAPPQALFLDRDGTLIFDKDYLHDCSFCSRIKAGSGAVILRWRTTKRATGVFSSCSACGNAISPRAASLPKRPKRPPATANRNRLSCSSNSPRSRNSIPRVVGWWATANPIGKPGSTQKFAPPPSPPENRSTLPRSNFFAGTPCRFSTISPRSSKTLSRERAQGISFRR